jgi:hypothetical protein
MSVTLLAFANGGDMAELVSTVLAGHESMYVTVFKGTRLLMCVSTYPQLMVHAEACNGVLSQEAHLFSNEEKHFLKRTLDLPCKFVPSAEIHLPPPLSFVRLYCPHEMQNH